MNWKFYDLKSRYNFISSILFDNKIRVGFIQGSLHKNTGNCNSMSFARIIKVNLTKVMGDFLLNICNCIWHFRPEHAYEILLKIHFYNINFYQIFAKLWIVKKLFIIHQVLNYFMYTWWSPKSKTKRSELFFFYKLLCQIYE